MRLIAVLSILLTSAAAVYGDGCRIVRQRVVSNKVIVQEAAVVAAYAVPYAVPLYSVGYDQGAGEIRQLRQAIEELRQSIQQLRSPEVVTVPKAETAESRAVAVLSARCAQCHTGAEAKGKNQIFLEPGKLNPAVDRFLLWEHSDSGIMPPEPLKPIPDDEVRVLREWLAEAAKQRKAEALKVRVQERNQP